MSKLHLYHISFFDTLLKGLKSNGVSINKLAAQSYINRFDLENPNTYLPVEVAYEFVNNVKRSQQIDCISTAFYGSFQLADLSEYGQFLSTCPDLYAVLVNGMKYETMVQTSGKMFLQTKGAITTYSMVHFDKPSLGRSISERLNLSMILKAFQFVLGADWSPVAVRVTDDNGDWLSNFLPLDKVKVYTNAPDIAVCFKTSELAVKNKHHKAPPVLTLDGSIFPESIVEKTLHSMSQGSIPSLQDLSDFFGCSRRTIIRSLAGSGASFKELVEKHLFSLALNLLNDHSISIEQISATLGYSDTSNFIRAFKGWTHTTPLKYRRQLATL